MGGTVLLVDDHPLFRQGVRTLLDPEITVREASGAAEALTAVTASPPDVAVVDSQLRDGGGIELIGAIRRRAPSVACILLTSVARADMRRQAAAAGAAALIVKNVPGEVLIDAIDRVARGERLLEADAPGRRAPDLVPSDPSLDQLSPQERRVVSLVVAGNTNKEAAMELGLAETTVRNYLSTVLRKLNLKNRTELAAYVTRVSVRGHSDHE